MHKADQLFGKMRDPATRAAIEEERQEVFEEGIVKRLLTFGERTEPVGVWRHDAEERMGCPLLTFAWFHEAFPRFPVRLGTEKLPRIHELTVADLFGPGFMKTPFMEAYRKLHDALERDDREERIGLVFNWPHIPTAGTMVLHTYPIECHNMPDPTLRTERNTRIVRPFGNPVVVYVLDPLAEFLISVGKDWATGD